MHPMFRRLTVATAAALATSLTALPSLAQSLDATRSAARKALQGNPEVTSRLNAYLGKVDAQSAARAGYWPKVDFNADASVNRFKDKDRTIATEKLNSSGAGLTISHVLWDGLATRNNVSRARHESLGRWYDLAETSEQTALEATRATYDVQRMRKLVALAEDNLAQHQQAAAKLESRVRAGVGRGVDLDQARARVALAEVNRDTEVSNLHDVAARYQRIVGETPASDMGAVELLRAGMPNSADEAVQAAVLRSPAIAAGVESMRAARDLESARRSAFHPQLSAKASVNGGKNLSGVQDRKMDSSIGLLLNWNLFNGGADSANLSEQKRAVAQAQDLRDKACRDVRQTTLIAFNDANKLSTQLNTLSRNSAAIERARDAYRQQFEIGQRSLLDLLNAENEAYTARRALTNAVYDRAVAYARTLASTAQLTAALGISRDMPGEGANWSAGGDAATRCPAQTVDVNALRAGNDYALPAQALQGYTAPQIQSAPAAQPTYSQAPVYSPAPIYSQAPVYSPAPQQQTYSPAPPNMASIMSAPLLNSLPSDSVETESADRGLSAASSANLASRVQAWARAQRKRDANTFANYYASDYRGTAKNNNDWRAQQRRVLAGQGELDLDIEEVSVKDLGNGMAETRFLQSRTTANGIEVNNTALTWKQVGGQWRIVRERKLG